MRRITSTIETLFGSTRPIFSQVDKHDITRHLPPERLADIVRWYWYNNDKDRRTKGSDLKRELTTIVTHLVPLIAAMKLVPRESKHALNRLLKPPTKEQPELLDIFGEAERLNALLLKHCQPLIIPKFTKQTYICVTNAGEALAVIWEGISQQSFNRNTKSCEAGRLVTDNFEFASDGMHFVHVMLQAIDPAITFSMVRTSMRRVAARSPKQR